MQKITKKNQEHIADMVLCFELFKKNNQRYSDELMKERPNLEMVNIYLDRALFMAKCAVDYAEMASLDPLKVVHHARSFVDIHKEAEQKTA